MIYTTAIVFIFLVLLVLTVSLHLVDQRVEQMANRIRVLEQRIAQLQQSATDRQSEQEQSQPVVHYPYRFYSVN